MSYSTRPEPITYWHITWADGQTSKWPSKLWSIDQLYSLQTIACYVLVNEAGIPIP